MLRKILKWLFKKEQVEIDSKVQKATELLDKAVAMEKTASVRNFTNLKTYPLDDELYLGRISELKSNEPFLFLVQTLKMKLLHEMIDEPENKALEYRGMLRGIDTIMQAIKAAESAYNTILERKRYESEILSQGSEEKAA
jgi:hypothetical protein